MKAIAAALSAICLACPSFAQDVTAGEELFKFHCATCHGIDARGNGPMAPALLVQPPSLHDLTERHGEFPVIRIVTRIDGRDPLVSHGSAMPVYGWFFEGDGGALKTDSGQPIVTSRAIVDLVEYLRSIQD